MFNKLRSSVFNLSHNVTGSANMGYIMPIACYDVVPGETIRHSVHALLRTQALIAPVMHTVDIDIDSYFVPDRIIWDDAMDFHSGGDDGLANPVAPTMQYPAEGYPIGGLQDCLGLPVITYDVDGDPIPVTSGEHSALPIRAYAKVRNDFYRDTQLQPEVVISTASGLDTTTSRVLLRPCWKRDYFTKARPQPQLGPEVVLPFSGDAPVTGIGFYADPAVTNLGTVLETEGSQAYPYGAVTSNLNIGVKADGAGAGRRPEIYADLEEAAGISIIEQREANAVQRFLEFNNNWGGRYIEQTWARFKSRVPDYRLDRPEFLGSGSAKFQFSEVLTTSEGATGNMSGHGISLVGSNKFRYRTPEHGWIIQVLVIRPKAQYMQGQHRMWNRKTKYDYLLPEFANIGDQAILNKELYVNSAAPDDTLGFTPIYEDYRTIPSRVFGEFRTTQMYWHMARIFASEPALNSTLVECVPTDRIFPVETRLASSVLMNISHKISARRPIPQTPNPRLM
nr:MAG: major capsid protein [Microvirus sp.]